MAGKSGFMKDAFILFAITLISGIALGGVYEVTKGPIEQATIEGIKDPLKDHPCGPERGGWHPQICSPRNR